MEYRIREDLLAAIIENLENQPAKLSRQILNIIEQIVRQQNAEAQQAKEALAKENSAGPAIKE